MQSEYEKDKFQCPHCTVVASQHWFDATSTSEVANKLLNHLYLDYRSSINDYEQTSIVKFLKEISGSFKHNIYSVVPHNLSVSTCSACNTFCLWVNGEMKYPRKMPLPSPCPDLNDEIKQLYMEAASILMDSPKGATALLRLALQKLLIQVGKSGKNINSDIKELVSKGLSPKIQQALDILRVVGNNAVHPGQINFNDNAEIANKLFEVLNFIAEELISKPKELEELYIDLIPEETQQHIKDRDK